MEIPLNLTKEKCEVFQDHLHAAIRKLTGMPWAPTGSAGYNGNGQYEITISIDFPFEASVMPLKLILPIETDGSLRKVIFHPISGDVANPMWSVHASNFIAGVLASALAENLSRFFIRSTFCRIGSDLDGEYWLPGFRFAPALGENEQSYLINAERYWYIDQEVDAIDEMHASDVAMERALQYSARLSLILDTGLYQPHTTEMRWFIEDKEGEGLVSRLRHLGFKPPHWPDKMPCKGTEIRLGRFETSIFAKRQSSTGLLMCPKEIRQILRGLKNCSPDVREAFDSCARLYQISLTAGRRFPTIRLAYQVGAVEAITRNVAGYRGFSDFIRKEFPVPDNSIDTFLDVLYGEIRSGHVHAGSFPLGEFDSKRLAWGIGNRESHDHRDIDLFASELIRQSLMRWVQKEVMSKGQGS